MQQASHSIRIRAAPGEVWDVLSDPASVPKWVYGARKVELVTDARRGVGAQWRQTNVYGPAVVVLLYEVTREDAPREWVVESVSKPHVELRHALVEESREDGEVLTRLSIDMSYEMPFGVVGRAAEPALGEFVGRALTRRSAETLKRLVERRAAERRDEPPVAP